MAIAQAVCNTFKKELLEGKHNFANGGHTFKIALFTSSANLIGSGLITNPTPDIYKADLTPSTNPAFSIPSGNQYLYLIYW